jgi:hypothetical protein
MTIHWPDPSRPDNFPDLQLNEPCCENVANGDHILCTCWEPIYNLDQQPVDEQARKLLAAGIEPVTRKAMCGDCAYRPGSPEKSGDESYRGDAEFLERIAAHGERFWCHTGMRVPVKWVHPSGAELPGHRGAYRPPIHDAIPYQADGSPAELCAGWDARNRALTATPEAENRRNQK